MSTKKTSQSVDDRKKFLILQINKMCRAVWSAKDQKSGKTIEIKWGDRKAARDVLPMYTAKGWIVSHEVLLDKRGRTVVVRIKRPPKEFFDALS